ncbi:ankyrin repeat-containing domain protein [Mycena galopus ATCC 62051]|nr:ankyrin repeat-containing domain protein [Mycena galopus ATCC 62051]
MDLESHETGPQHLQTINYIHGGVGGRGGLGLNQGTGGGGGTGEGPTVNYHTTTKHLTMINMEFAQQTRSFEMNGERGEIMQSLAPINFFQNHANVSRTREHGTGQWLLEDPHFLEWKYSTGRTLWCRGIRASMVVDKFSEEFLDKNIRVACIYLNHKETDKQTPANLLAGLWRQLVFGKDVGALAKKLYQQHREKQTSPSTSEAFRMLCQAITQFSKVYIVIDGMDEYPEDQQNILQKYLSQMTPRVNLMVTSRFNIAADLDSPNCDVLDIRAKVPRLRKLVQNAANLTDEIQSKIAETVDGMFLLAKLHMDDLTSRRTVKGIRESLKVLPKSLDHSYENVMKRIEGQTEEDKQIAYQTLTWVANAKRPSTAVELQTALAIEPNAKSLDKENILDIDLILEVCAGLVIMDEMLSSVQLVHYTTQEYFNKIQVEKFPDAQTQIACTLFTYLAFDEFSDAEQSYIIGGPLFRYAQYCLAHAAGAPEAVLRNMILEFLAWPPLYTEVVKERWRFPPWDCLPWPSQPGALWVSVAANLVETAKFLLKLKGAPFMPYSDSPEIIVASYYGHLQMVQLLVEYGADVNVQGGKYHTALQAAASSGQFNITKWLLHHGADINAQGGQDGNAVQAASYWGYEHIVRLLIEHRADMKVQEGFHGGVLQVASAGGHVEIVKLLIQNGVDVNTQDQRYGTALHAASSAMYISTHTHIAKLLIECGADVNAKSGPYGSSLQAASANGHIDIAQLLIEHDADVNLDAGPYGSPLHLAFSTGNFDILEVLLEHGANVRAEPYSILHAALSNGHCDIFKLLVENGADVNVRAKNHGTCLRTACTQGNSEIVQLLIKYGADVNADVVPYSGLLHETFSKGHLDIFNLLVEHGADVNVRDEDYGTCLGRVCVHGNLEMAQLLIGHGADVNADTRPYNSLLHETFLRGHLDIFRFLVEHGANVNVQDQDYGTCLRTVCVHGNCEIAQLLIEHGADVNADTRPYNSLLHEVFLRGHLGIFKLLVEHGANVNVGDEDYGTCLGAISVRGNLEMTKLLLEHGADVNADTVRYGSLLHAVFERRHLEIFKLLLKHGANVNVQQENYGSCLRMVCMGGNFEIAQLLIDCGADVNVDTTHHGSLLHAVFARRHLDIFKLLVKHGADVNVQHREQGTCLQVASVCGNLDIVQFLIHHGANVNAQGGQYSNALHAAFVLGRDNIASVLLEHGAQKITNKGLFGDIFDERDLSKHGDQNITDEGLLGGTSNVLSNWGTINNSEDGVQDANMELCGDTVDLASLDGRGTNALQLSFDCSEDVIQDMNSVLSGDTSDVASDRWGDIVQFPLNNDQDIIPHTNWEISGDPLDLASDGQGNSSIQLPLDHSEDVIVAENRGLIEDTSDVPSVENSIVQLPLNHVVDSDVPAEPGEQVLSLMLKSAGQSCQQRLRSPQHWLTPRLSDSDHLIASITHNRPLILSLIDNIKWKMKDRAESEVD